MQNLTSTLSPRLVTRVQEVSSLEIDRRWSSIPSASIFNMLSEISNKSGCFFLQLCMDIVIPINYQTFPRLLYCDAGSLREEVKYYLANFVRKGKVPETEAR